MGTNQIAELSELENKKINILLDDDDESTIREYYNLRQRLDTYAKDMRDVINHPVYCLQFMQPGRLVKVRYLNHDFGWGAVVNYSKRMRSKVSNKPTPFPGRFHSDKLYRAARNFLLRNPTLLTSL
jgi:ATP-dependent RNA helicase DOB1